MQKQTIYPHQVIGLPLGKITIVTNRNTNAKVKMVYQRVGREFGNIRKMETRALQLRRHVPQRDPRKPIQLAGRRRMAAAIRAYQALSIEDREPYRLRAKGTTRSGYAQFISEFCLLHPAEKYLVSRVKLQFYAGSGMIVRPSTPLKYYLAEAIP